MKIRVQAIAILSVYWILAVTASARPVAHADEHGQSYLDETYGKRALEWVDKEQARTLRILTADPAFEGFQQDAVNILTDSSRLGSLKLMSGYITQYWQDRDAPMGVWRRTPERAWLNGEPEWETLIDFDVLGLAEKRRWIFGGADCRANGRCLVQLSDNGKDSVEIREFDLTQRSFVADGFHLPLGKHSIWWQGDNTVLVAPVLGQSSLNSSLLPKTLRVWHRGQQLSQAKTIFSIGDTDAFLSAILTDSVGSKNFIVVRSIDFERQEFWLMNLEGETRHLPLPELIDIYSVQNGNLLLRPKVDWIPAKGGQTMPAGSLVGINLTSLLETATIVNPKLIYSPSGDDSVRGTIVVGKRLFVELLHDGYSRIEEITANAPHTLRPLFVPLSDNKFVTFIGALKGKLLLHQESPLTPGQISLVDPDTGEEKILYSRSAAFDTTEIVQDRYHTVSADGTRISYTIMHKRDLRLDRKNPTLVYGYGGYDVPVTPRYEPIFGKLWLEKGGVYVHANLRGGGEHGPEWHRATMGKDHPRAFEDMEAVLRDLHRRKISSPEHTGIIGRSNGGLLVAAVMQRQPNLMNAVVVGGPLIDMLNFHKLPPGGTWLAEYGDPDKPEIRAFLREYSPMQNIAGPEVHYPTPLIITSTDDDRVLPGHARRYADLLREKGHQALYYEDDQGGHYWELAGGPAPGDWRRRSVARAAEFTYLWSRLKN